jgi:hypothetical protein
MYRNDGPGLAAYRSDVGRSLAESGYPRESTTQTREAYANRTLKLTALEAEASCPTLW